MFPALTESQLKQQADDEQAFAAWQDATHKPGAWALA